MIRGAAALAACAGAVLLGAASCTRDEGAARGGGTPPAVPVAAEAAVLGDAPITVRTIGWVQSPAHIVLRPQVTGRVEELAVKEGSDVEKGRAILRIDPRPFRAGLDAAEARLAGARAQAADADRNVKQLRAVYASEAAAQREIDAADAAAKMAAAAVLAAEAAVESSRLDLAYCEIESPFAGRLGEFLVRPGSIVSAHDTDLVDLTQTDPIEVSLSIPEQNLAGVRDAAAKGPVRVEAKPTGDPGPAASGELTFIDNKVDISTGTVRLKAGFANESRRLWPGQFSDVVVVLGEEKARVLVPQSAVQASQNGPSVYVVKPDRTVDLRMVDVGRTVEGRTVIAGGVAAGELVVTDGHVRLAPGVKVQVKGAAAAGPARASRE